MKFTETQLKRRPLYAEQLGIKLANYRRKTLTYCRLEAGLIWHRKEIVKQLP